MPLKNKITNMKTNNKHENYVQSYNDVRSLVSTIREKRANRPVYEYFRGQVSDTFELKPSLSRCFSESASLINVEKLLMEDFKKEMIDYNKIDKLFISENPIEFQNEWAWLVQAQHYRLPTRMLDWTLRWDIALYFAVEEQFGDKKYLNSHEGQFWVFYVPDEIIMSKENQNSYYQTDPYKFYDNGFLNSALCWTKNYENEIAERRRTRQQGKFSIQSALNSLTPMEQQKNINPFLKKYLIPSEAKNQIRLDLAKEGITGEFLYAGEDETINCIISSLNEKYGL